MQFYIETGTASDGSKFYFIMVPGLGCSLYGPFRSKAAVQRRARLLRSSGYKEVPSRGQDLPQGCPEVHRTQDATSGQGSQGGGQGVRYAITYRCSEFREPFALLVNAVSERAAKAKAQRIIDEEHPKAQHTITAITKEEQ